MAYDNRNKKIGGIPTAPYNFVPLNNVVIKPPLAEFLKKANDTEAMQNGYKNFIKSGEKYSGYFDVQIKNITPFYIAGEKGFFSDGENICVPGSSLRGCIKNIFKIITNSAVRVGDNPDITDKHLYFRAMASGFESLRKSYNDRMVTKVKISGNKEIGKSSAMAGFIVREDKKYFVCPAEYKSIKISSKSYVREPSIKWNSNNEAFVYTGRMNNKKHYYKVFNPKWNTKLEISEDIVRDYRDDKNRKGLDLLDEKENLKNNNARKFNNFKYAIPCFYVEDSNSVEHFGAGPYYRIPYKASIGDRVPKVLKNAKIDFTDAVFGNKECWSSRVYFEDSYLEKGTKANFYDKDYVKILMGPNPTSFQFYLNSKNSNAYHWDNNDNVNIRGYKFYWHKKLDSWRETNPKMRSDKINKQIAPLKENHTFMGKIRFKNLDRVELGALAYILSLCEQKNICFKLGMGKPVGMGSVKITAKLKLFSDNYYTKLFNIDDSFIDAELVEMNNFIKDFNDYIDNQLKNSVPSAQKNYENRKNALLTILDISFMNKRSWNECTRYYDINSKDDKRILNKRIPLPTIKEVASQAKK